MQAQRHAPRRRSAATQAENATAARYTSQVMPVKVHGVEVPGDGQTEGGQQNKKNAQGLVVVHRCMRPPKKERGLG
eukprot:gene8360-10716_t